MKKIKRAFRLQHLKFYCDLDYCKRPVIKYLCSYKDVDLRKFQPRLQLISGRRLNLFLDDFASGHLIDSVLLYGSPGEKYPNLPIREYISVDALVMDTYGETLILNLAGLQESTKNEKR